MNRARICVSDVALNDILEQSDWYEHRSGEGLARRWAKEVTSALIRIKKNPRSGAKCSFTADELQDIRRMPIAGFPKHLILYHADDSENLILRVVHGARDLESLF